MIFQEPMRRRWPDACENAFEMIADESPDGGWVQLLHSANHPALKPGGDKHQGIARLAKFGMQSGQREGLASGHRRLAACSVLRPTEDINHGRLVIASRRACGLARRTNRLHQL